MATETKLDNVLKVEVKLNVDGEILIDHKSVMCAKDRARVFNGINRLLKPPAKRKKGSPDAT